MIAGTRNETLTDRDKRHKEEIQQLLSKWKNELEFINKKLDSTTSKLEFATNQNALNYKKYKKHCQFMINTFENILDKWEDFDIESKED